MKLTSISFRNFRNLRDAQVVDVPSEPLLVAVAPNATGKTNFLEAIAMLLRGKSFRGSHEECVTWGADFFLVQGQVEGREGMATVAVQYHVPSRKLRIEQDTHPISPVVFYANYPYVMFVPEDTFLLHRGPALRRNFLNNSLAASTAYLSGLVQYQRALRQRNTALKDAHSPADVAAWTSVLSEHAAVIWDHREALVRYLAAQLPPMITKLLAIDDPLTLRLTRGVPNGKNLSEALEDVWAQEQRYKYTLLGPHRDDLEVFVAGRPARAVLSRGQIRSLVTALKIVVYQFIKQTSAVTPLLLLDEVLSELDSERQRQLFEILPNTQTLLTCTDIPAEIKRRSDVYLLDLKQLTGKSSDNVAPEHVPVQTEEKVPA